MATNGTIQTNTTYDSYFWLNWAVDPSQTESDKLTYNRTLIAWECGVYGGHSFYNNALRIGSVVINGETVYSGGTFSGSSANNYFRGYHAIGSGKKYIAHAKDGSMTLDVGAFTGELYDYTDAYGNVHYYNFRADGRSYALPTIARATTPSIADAVMGTAVSISLPRASAAFTHTLRYSFGNRSGSIATGAGTSVRWEVPLSLAEEIPNAASGTGKLTCVTYNGATVIGSKEVTFTAIAPQSLKPTIHDGWVEMTYDNSGTAAAAIRAWVQGYSKAIASFHKEQIETQYGASIKGYSVEYLGHSTSSAPYRTETIKATTARVRCCVRDSRGLSAYEDVSVVLHEYAPPVLIGADLWRADESGAAADDGTYLAGVGTAKIASLGGCNSACVRGYWRQINGAYGDGTELCPGQRGFLSQSISTDLSYMAKIVLTDALGNTAVYEEVIPTERVAFHLKSGGTGAAFGKVAETDHLLEVAEEWDFKVKGKLLRDLIHPVGSIYLSAVDAQPDSLFGGEWIPLRAGTFSDAGESETPYMWKRTR